MARLSGATEYLERALRNASKRETEKIGEVLKSFVPDFPFDQQGVDQLDGVSQALIWEAAWRVAPWAIRAAGWSAPLWTTRRAALGGTWYTSPYFSDPTVRRAVGAPLGGGDSDAGTESSEGERFDRFAEARRLLKQSIEIESKKDWNHPGKVYELSRNVWAEWRDTERQRRPASNGGREHLSRVFLLGDPDSLRPIFEHSFIHSEQRNHTAYATADYAQFALFALTRASTASSFVRTALIALQNLRSVKSDRGPASALDLAARAFLLYFILLVALFGWRARATLVARAAIWRRSR